MRFFSKSAGVTLAELMVATVLIASGVIVAMGSFRYISQALHQSRSKTIANNLAQEKIEVLKNLSYYQLLVTTNAYEDSNYTPHLFYDQSAYAPDNFNLWGLPPFKRVVYIAYADTENNVVSTMSYTATDPGLKAITVYVLWNDRGTPRKIELHSLLTNPSAATLDSGFNGTVNRQGGGVVPGALVLTLGNPFWKAQADSTGGYSFAVAHGSYTLACSSAGYYTSTSPQQVANRGSSTPYTFTLVPIASGTATGTVWISTQILISHVVASTQDSAGQNQEFVELYNPTTYTWLMDSGGAANLTLQYREKDSSSLITYALTYRVHTIAPKTYYLIASTGTIQFYGANRSADAVYNCTAMGLGLPPCNVMVDSSSGGLGLQNNTGEWLDRVAWSKTSSGMNAPNYFTETTGIPIGGGLNAGEQIVRYSHPGGLSSGEGRAYDTDINSVNWFYFSTPYYDAENSAVNQSTAAGKPAWGAFVSADDGNSVSTQAVTVSPGTGSEKSVFTISGVSTGTWDVTAVTGTYASVFSNVTVSQNLTTNIGNVAITSRTLGGFIQGYVKGSGANYSTGINNILVESSGYTTRTSASGYYLLNVDTGPAVINANFNGDNAQYTTASNAGSVYTGQITTLTDFHIGLGGSIKGYVTSGTGALPNIVVQATEGSNTYSGTSDQTGYFYVNVATDAAAYTVQPILDPLESYSSSPSPMTATVLNAGQQVFGGTITVSGALGTISGNVKNNGNPITTGVLIVASTGTISDPPTWIYGSTAPALASPFYSISSLADGSYTVDVRSGGGYNLRAFFPQVNQDLGTVSYTSKALAGVTVTAGNVTSGQNFTWP